MTEFLVQPAGVRLTWSLVHFLWQGAAIAALLVIVLRLTTTLRMRGRYMLSMAALGLMAICPLATWFALGDLELPGAAQSSLVDHRPQDVELTLEANTSTSLMGENAEQFQRFVPALQPYLLFAWLLGVLLLGGRLVSGYVGTLWLKGGRTPAPFAFAQRAIEIGRRLGVNATSRIFGCSRVPEAVAVGFWKPIVLVPICWLTELPPNVLEAVIAHELAHIRRWDLWAMLVQRVIETLLFYHPAVWWLSRRVSLEREMCCDELAVLATGRPVVYAQVLEYLGARTAVVSSLALATSFKGAKNMNLLTRVQQVLGVRSKPESGRLWLAGVLSVVLAAGIFAASSSRFDQSAMADDEPAKSRREGDRKDGDRRDDAVRDGDRREGAVRDGDRREGVRRDSDADAPPRDGQPRRAAEPRDGDRKAAEREGRGTAAGDGERRKDAANSLEGFKPQNDREESLYKMILQLQRETAELRDQLHQSLSGSRDGAVKDRIRRLGERGAAPVARDGDAPVRHEARDGDERKPAARDGDGDRPKARDGEERKAAPRDGDRE